MSLAHQLRKYCNGKGYNPPDFTGDILLQKKKGKDGAVYIAAWPKSGYGSKPALADLPNDAESVKWCVGEDNKKKVDPADLAKAKTFDELRPILEKICKSCNLFIDTT